MRSNLDNNRARGLIVEGALITNVSINAIAANVVLTTGQPFALGFDPASTNRTITLYTPAVPGLTHEHEIFNVSVGTGVLTILSPAAATLGTIGPGQRGILRWINGAWGLYVSTAANSVGTIASTVPAQQYTLLASLANAQVMSMALPFNFKLNSVGFRTRVVASTAAKLATLTAQVNGVSVTGGVVSLTTANQNVSGGFTAGTAITAGNAGTAGQTIGVVASAVTAFVEGDGYVEYGITNTSLAA